MLLRTYPLIIHPAFIAHIEAGYRDPRQLSLLPPTDTPEHRPVLRRVTDVAEYLKISPYLIRDMMSRKVRHYRQFPVTKRSGAIRTISAPRTFLKVVQWWILDCILSRAVVPSFVHGFVSGRSFLSKAKAHVGARYILNVDIKDFFPSVKTHHAVHVFRNFGFNEKVCLGLTELCTLGGSLPQGAPSSPMIANLAMAEVDSSLSVFAEMNGLRFTRYADDLTFSGQERIPTDYLDDIERVLEKSGFSLNHSKTRFMGANQVKEVTGLVVTNADVRLSRGKLNEMRGWFHRLTINPYGQVDCIDELRGLLSLVSQVGGPGSASVIDLGRRAIHEIEQAVMKSDPAEL